MTHFLKLSLLILTVSFFACETPTPQAEQPNAQAIQQNEANFIAIMQKHLDAVTNRDLQALKSTLHPDGKMQLILPGQPIEEGAKAFMDFHEGWFKDTTWTQESKMLNTTIGERVGMAVTESTYREPLRDGQPYFNQMIVSYDLEKVNGTWCIIKDQMCSIRKSTDKE